MVGFVISSVSYVGYSITSSALQRSVLMGLHTSAHIASDRFRSFLEQQEAQLERMCSNPIFHSSSTHLLRAKNVLEKQGAQKRLHIHATHFYDVTRIHISILSMRRNAVFALPTFPKHPSVSAFTERAFQHWKGASLFSLPFQNADASWSMIGAKWLFSKSRSAIALVLFTFEIPKHLLEGVQFGDTGRVSLARKGAHLKFASAYQRMQGVFKNEQGQKYMGVWHSVGWPGLWVEARMGIQEAMASIVWLRWIIGVGTLLVLMASLLIVVSFTKTITLPIQRLSSIAYRIAQGAYTLRAPVDAKDEVGELAEQFNHMAKRVVAKQQRFEDLLDTASDAILSIDEEQQIVLFNHQAETIFGYTQEEVIGQSMSILLPKKYHAQHPQYVRSFGEEKGQRRLMGQRRELQGIRKNGECFPVDVSISKLFWEGEWLYTAIVRDITEQRKAERVIQEAQELLEQRVHERTVDLRSANEELRSFTYIVSHDLRAPLVNLKGFSGELTYALDELRDLTEALRPHCTPQQTQDVQRIMSEDIPECLDFIQSSTSRMESLINAILSLSRVGYRTLSFESIELEEVLQEVVKSMAHQIEQKNIQVTWDALPQVCADRISLAQILANLIHNATKYVRPQTESKIQIYAHCKQHETEISIRDNGRGIAEEDIPKIFELFRRVGEQGESGEGMGLNFVRTLVRRHGGRIDCVSELGTGSTFTFSLRNTPSKEEVTIGNVS